MEKTSDQSSSFDKAQAWANNPVFDNQSRKEIQSLIDNDNQKEIEERFYKDLEFGTGGIRSILGQGINRINIYTIRKATQALCIEVLAQNASNPSICISYDSRNFSFEFAKVSAEVMAGNGIRAYIYKRLNPVAMLSFSVRHHKSMAGVMVTASHNPPEYNGYKVFWSDGAQVIPPNDQNIINNYNSITDFGTIKFIPFDEGEKKELIKWVGEDVENLYHAAIRSKAVNPELCHNDGSKLRIVYTPIHGSGLVPCKKELLDSGFSDLHIVAEQAEPDGNFPTVKSPNPENPTALKLAVDLLEKTNADIVLGTDPDTDRLGVAIKSNGKIEYLTGNQIGILKLHYILSQLKKQNKLTNNSYFVKSIVTTSLLDVIAKSFGTEVYNTLTGFKWICGKMNQIEKSDPGKQFIFATEESFGYLCHTFARDKDGVSSVAMMAEVALFYKLQGMDLLQALDKIYEEYGFSHESLLSLDYFGIEGQEKISRIMTKFRKISDNTMVGNRILEIRDYAIGYADLPKSNVLGFFFENGDQFYLRPSGTEPKIKFYIMIQEKSGTLNDKKKRALEKTDTLLAFIKETVEKA
ncbi:MAG: phospho-sugar mutase [Bacteriovorax sp.]|nr:phospho-sugar mutase [Bacteriovorax sp.]